jgi:hypothetical protein
MLGVPSGSTSTPATEAGSSAPAPSLTPLTRSSAPAAPGSSAPATSDSSAPSPVATPTPPSPAPMPQDSSHSVTRLQRGIRTPQVYIDGTICYGQIAATSEGPTNSKNTLTDVNWKHAMDLEIEALHKNKTWHLVPPKKGET